MKGLVGLALALVACRGASAPSSAGDRAVLVAHAAPDDEVVAQVNGAPIYASAVRAQAEAAHEDARHAALDLVSAELLAEEALRRGFHEHASVREAARQAAVRLLLHRVFERERSPERVPDALYEKLYRAAPQRFDHDDAVEVWHLLAQVPKDAPPEAWEAARARMKALRPQAVAAPTDAAFTALARSADPGEPPLRTEHFTFPRHGAMVESFAAAAFALDKPGEVSGLVETPYGVHLIRLVKRVPAVHETLAQAKPQLRDEALADFRQAELEAWLRDLDEHAHVVVHPERLGQEEAP